MRVDLFFSALMRIRAVAPIAEECPLEVLTRMVILARAGIANPTALPGGRSFPPDKRAGQCEPRRR